MVLWNQKKHEVIWLFFIGLLFFVPGGNILFLTWSMLAFAQFIRSNFKVSFLALLHGLQIFALLLPIILIIGSLSHYLLSDFQQQLVVTDWKNNPSEDWFEKTLLVLVVAPLAEEFYFRQLLLPPLVKMAGLFWAIFLTSVFFALVHLNIYAFPCLFLVGVALGLVRFATQKWMVAVFCHSFFNGVMLLLILGR